MTRWTVLQGLDLCQDLSQLVEPCGWLVALAGDVLIKRCSEGAMTLLLVQLTTEADVSEALACLGALGFDVLGDGGCLHGPRGQAIDVRWMLQ